MKKIKLFLNLKTLWNNQRIRQRILIYYLVVVLLPVTFINAWTFMQSRHAVLVKVEDTLDVTLVNVNSSFNTLLTGKYDRDTAISRAP